VFGGRWAGILFGIALLASGQSSTMTGTYAGQFVMEGFLNWKIAVWKRNLITRSVAIVPSLAVALIFGDKGSDSLIVFSQVILAVQLPYCMIPMLKITSSKKRMINPTLQNSLPFTITGWGLGCLVMAANVFLISTTISELDGLFVETKANLIFAAICVLAVVYFGFTVYLVLFNVDNILEHVPTAMEEAEAVDKVDEEQPLVDSASDSATPISINS
jgi:natural resistance-associated macrophage protein 2